MLVKLKYRIKLFYKYFLDYIFNYFGKLINYFKLVNLYEKKYNDKFIAILPFDAIGPFILYSNIYYRKCVANNIDPKNDLVLIINDGVSCNNFYFDLISRSFNIQKDPVMFNLIISSNNFLLKKRKILLVNKLIKNGIIYNSHLNSLFKFTEEEKNRGKILLKKMGISESDRLVSVNNRDNYYWEKIRKCHFTHDTYRMSSFANLLPTIKYLQGLNYKIIRCGHFDENEISQDSNIISMQNFNIKDREFLDIYLHYKVEFSIMGSSGIAFAPLNFGKPILYHNFIPLGEGPNAENCVIVPSLIKNSKGDILSLSKIFQMKEWINDCGVLKLISADRFQNSQFYKWNDMIPEESASEDILAGVKELLIRIKNKKFNDEFDENQRKFKNKFPLDHPIRHMVGVCSSDFLNKYGNDILK
ncbi:TIGR04372 family glycosyltransferase [Silvanigrella paludirubra]|nr:TIGR04372 family glycosyltransferase [Silvanigrella paludirubra]